MGVADDVPACACLQTCNWAYKAISDPSLQTAVVNHTGSALIEEFFDKINYLTFARK